MPGVTNDKRGGMLSRIDALLRLAKDQGATPDEAARAMEAAQRLMQKYQISQLEAEAKGAQDRAQFGHELVELSYKGLTIEGKRQLLHGACKACYAEMVANPGKPNAFILGRSENRQAAKLMYLRLELEVLRLASVDARREQRECARSGKGFIGVQAWKNRFGLGASIAIAHRLVAYRAELDAALYKDAPQSQALMVLEQDALNRYLDDQFQTKTRQIRTRQDSAFMLGHRAGEALDLGLNRKLGGQGSGPAQLPSGD